MPRESEPDIYAGTPEDILYDNLINAIHRNWNDATPGTYVSAAIVDILNNVQEERAEELITNAFWEAAH